MSILLRYGSRERAIPSPDGELSAILVPSCELQDEDEVIGAALREPIDSEPLHQLARGKRSAAILIPGKTRVAGTQKYVPALIKELNEAGIPDSNIKVFLATGTHEHHLECDFEGLLGTDTARRIECIAHDCHDQTNLTSLGVTSFGTPVQINSKVLDCDVIIPTGRIVPHYFAGFTGGRKAIIPGVAGFRTICANHKLTLAESGGINPGVGCGKLDGNPVHMDMIEGVRMVNPSFVFNTVMDHLGRIIGAVSGHWESAHQAGCEQSGNLCDIKIDRQVDAIITSAGGAPYDCNFMQSLKAVFNVKDIVRPGGFIFWVAECTAGIQSEFSSWCSISSTKELDLAVRERYDLKGHNSLMLRNLVDHCNVALYSSLQPDLVAGLGLHPLPSMEAGVEWINRSICGRFNYALVPFANVISASALIPV